MTHKLILTYTPEDEVHGELRASIESAGYIGQGSAWFSAEKLHSFCAAIGEYPISSESPPSLNGGYWNDEGQVLVQTHVGLTVTPYDVRGSLLVSVQLSTPIWELEGHNLHRSVEAHFRIDYPSLQSFRASLVALVASEADAATLDGY